MTKRKWTFILLTLTFYACRQDAPVFPEIIESDYQPLTKGSAWTYQGLNDKEELSTSSIVLNGNTKTMKGKKFFEAVYTVNGEERPENFYYAVSGHVYTIRLYDDQFGFTLDMDYLHEDLPENVSWTHSLTDDGIISGIPGRVSGKILAKDVVRTVKGYEFKDVIHTEVQVQHLISDSFETWATYHFYIAKNVGIIEISSDIDYLGIVKQSATAKLTNFTVK